MKTLNRKVFYYITQIPKILKSSTVEISLFFLMISCLGVYTICEDLALEKACRVNLKFSNEICESIITRNQSVVVEEAAMQRLVSTVKSSHAVVDYGLPIIVMMFLGPLSDVFGRKVPMLVAVTGYVLQFIGAILSGYFENWDLWTFKFILSTTRAIGGGEAAYNMAAMAYISDLTFRNPSLRTVRTGILYSFFISGVPIGSAFGAKLSSLNLGYVKSLIIASIPGFISFFIVLYFVENTRNIERAKIVTEMNSKVQVLRFIFNPRSTWIEIFKTLSKPRQGFTRFNIIAVIISHFCIMAPMSAEFTVRYLFLRIQLHWNLIQFGNYSTFSYIIGIIGVIVSMGLLSHFLKLSDPVVGFVSGISQFSSCFIYTFARTSFMMYLAPVVDMMNGTMVVINKSILSKLVEQEEVGNLFAFVGVVDSVSPLLLVPTYNILYKATFTTLPGTFYLLSAGLTIPAFIVFAWLIYEDVKKGDGWFQKTTDAEHGITITRF